MEFYQQKRPWASTADPKLIEEVLKWRALRVAPRPFARQERGRQQRSACIAVARVALVDQLQRFAERAANNGVLADVVAGAQGFATTHAEKSISS